jgi:hypothetical protein
LKNVFVSCLAGEEDGAWEVNSEAN